MGTRACKGFLQAPVCSEKPWAFVYLKGAWSSVLPPWKKLTGHHYSQLAGHLTGSLTGALTGHELVGTNLW